MIEGERKLATIRRVAALDPIPGADRIVKATIDGWELVTQKDNFQVGDLCVYFEIDSFLPVRPEFEFLRKACFKSTKNLGDGFRLKTIKLKGQVSQGLILPMKDFFVLGAAGFWEGEGGTVYQEGDDVTEYLGVQKYEKPIPAQLAGQVRGNFPSFLRKTDQERIQNCYNGVKNWIYVSYETDFVTSLPVDVTPDERGFAHDVGGFSSPETWYIPNEGGWIRRMAIAHSDEVVESRRVFEATLKLDGSSMSVYYNEGQIGVCSRNLDLKRDMENLFWKTAVYSGVVGMLAHLGRNIAVQGELMGPGVQGNREKLENWCFFIFDVFDIDEQRYMTPSERMRIAAVLIGNPLEREDYNVSHVPVLNHAALPFGIDGTATVQKILDASDNVASLNVPTAEGIVYKSHEVNGPSFKAISNKYLLAEKD